MVATSTSSFSVALVSFITALLTATFSRVTCVTIASKSWQMSVVKHVFKKLWKYDEHEFYCSEKFGKSRNP